MCYILALISCPECNREVSDKAPACVHCGFPIPVEKVTVRKLLEQNGGDKEAVKEIIMVKYGNSEAVAITMVETEALRDLQVVDEIASAARNQNKALAQQPKCPACSSINISKIGTMNRVGSVALFGIFSMGHVSKTFKCNQCGYSW
jgi:hypothetical protein